MREGQHSWAPFLKALTIAVGIMITVVMVWQIRLADLIAAGSVLGLCVVSYRLWGVDNKYFLALIFAPLATFGYILASMPAVVLVSWFAVVSRWLTSAGTKERVYLNSNCIILASVADALIKEMHFILPNFVLHARILEAVLFTIICYYVHRESQARLCRCPAECICKTDYKQLWVTVVLATVSANVADSLMHKQFFLALSLGIFFLTIVIVYINEVQISNFSLYLNSIFISINQGIAIYDLKGRVERCNQHFQDLLDIRSLEEIHPKYHVTEKLLQLEATQQANTLNYCVITPSGKRLEVLLTPVRNNKGQLERFVCFMEDITYQVLWEEKDFKQEKFSLVGELAAGFAHEIKNPLTSMKGFFQLLKTSQSQRHIPGEKSYIENILAEIEKVNLMVSEFLGLAKPRGSKLAFADISYIFDEIKPWIDSEALLYNVTVTYLVEPNLPMLVMDVEEIKQALLHIISNAYKAMPKGGLLIIRVDKSDSKLVIHIQDTGTGISKENLPRVFEPFYSTNGSRIGLGLTVTKDIIDKHQGTINIESAIGLGTTVTLELPYQTN